jgi:hypothetical protein
MMQNRKAGYSSAALINTVPQKINPFTASCENAMTLSVPGTPASRKKFPHSSQLNFWSTE